MNWIQSLSRAIQNHNHRDFYIRAIVLGGKKKSCMMKQIFNL